MMLTGCCGMLMQDLVQSFFWFLLAFGVFSKLQVILCCSTLVYHNLMLHNS